MAGPMLINALVMVMVFAAVVLVVLALAPMFDRGLNIEARLSGIPQAASRRNRRWSTMIRPRAGPGWSSRPNNAACR